MTNTNCNKCGAEIRQGKKFCGGCGSPVSIERRCLSCSALLEVNENFCSDCGAKYKNEQAKPTAADSIVVGSSYRFADYDWRVLSIENGKALLISEKILEKRPYHEDNGNATWEHCTLRKYLNGELYNSFGDAKSKITDTHNLNPDNLLYRQIGGNPTVDKVFLLNIDEVCRYFGDSVDVFKKHIAEEYPSGWISDDNNIKRIATYEDCDEAWTLRSPGRNIDGVACVDYNGQINLNGYAISSNEGIRPALWLNLQ